MKRRLHRMLLDGALIHINRRQVKIITDDMTIWLTESQTRRLARWLGDWVRQRDQDIKDRVVAVFRPRPHERNRFR